MSDRSPPPLCCRNDHWTNPLSYLGPLCSGGALNVLWCILSGWLTTEMPTITQVHSVQGSGHIDPLTLTFETESYCIASPILELTMWFNLTSNLKVMVFLLQCLKCWGTIGSVTMFHLLRSLYPKIQNAELLNDCWQYLSVVHFYS